MANASKMLFQITLSNILLLLASIVNNTLCNNYIEFDCIVLTANTQATITTTRHTRNILNCKIIDTPYEM